MMAACRSCGAPVVWKRTPKGKPIPLDPNPVDNGNIVVDGNTAEVVGPLEAIARGAGQLYVSHFATCPDANHHRNR